MTKRTVSRLDRQAGLPIGVLVGLISLIAGLLTGSTAAAAASPDDAVTPAASTSNVIVDPSWQPTGGVGDLVSASVLQPDGKLVVVGPFTSVNGERRVTITRLNTDGTLDPSFDAGEGFDGPVNDLALQPDGKIIAAGSFLNAGGVARRQVARLLPDGQLDAGFEARAVTPAAASPTAGRELPTMTNWLGAAKSTPFASAGSGAAAMPIRGSSDVTPATGDPVVRGLALQPDGKIVIFGSNLNYTGTMTMVVGRLNSDGTYDSSFAAPYSSSALQVVGDAIALPDGTTVVGGYDYMAGRPILARLAANGSLDPTWALADCNGPVWGLTRMVDGKILAAGGFATCGGLPRRGLVRLQPTGAVDPTFSIGGGFDRAGQVAGPEDIAVLSNGQLLVVGYFTAVDGHARPEIARLNALGGLDVGFSPAAPGGPVASALGAYVWFVQAQADGRVVIGGMFGSVAGARRTGLARLGIDGSLDPDYHPTLHIGVGLDSWASDVVVEPAGKLMLTGGFASYNGDAAQAMVRLNPNGTRDATFSTVGTGLAFADVVVRQPDGRYIVAGGVAISQSAVVLVVMRLNANGSRDPSFAAQRYDLAVDQQIVHCLALQSDGKVLVAGQFTGPDGRANLMRLGTNGLPDPSFSIGSGFVHPALGLLGVRALVLQADGRIVAAGAFTHVNGVPRSGIVRLQAGGTVDPSFNPGGGFTGTQAMVRALVPAPGGRLLAAGTFDYFDGQPRPAIARLNANGSLDVDFNPNPVFGSPWAPTAVALTSLVSQADGRVITTGNFISFSGVSRKGILRLTPSGALDASFDPGSGFPGSQFATDAYIVRAGPQPDGAIVLAGQFQGFNDTFPDPLGVTRIVVVAGPPSAPTGVSVTNGNGAVLVTCTPPDPGAGGWAQRYEFSADGGATWPVSSTTPTAALTGLTNDETYQVRVRAVNLAGTGPASATVAARPQAPPATTFVPVAPARVVDSRASSGGAGPIAAGTSRVMSVATSTAGVEVVPVGAVAIAYNLTVPSPTAGGHLRVMPGDAVGVTSASSINFRRGETIANAAIVRVDAARDVKVYAGSTADVIVDVLGYFVSAPPAVAGQVASVVPSNGAGGRFTPVVPVRVYDAAVDPAGLLAGGASRLVSTATTQVGQVPVVPAGATAVAYNITVVDTLGAGHLRVMPGDVASTGASAINWSTIGERIANGSVVAVDAQRQIRVFNGGGPAVRFLVDVVGYYSATGAAFYPVDPVRTMDSRVAYGGAGAVATGQAGIRDATVARAQDADFPVAPAGATAAAYNATVAATGSMGHLRVFPAGAALVNASTLNWPGAGYTRANATTVGVSPADRSVTLYNGATTSTDVLIDVNGYFR